MEIVAGVQVLESLYRKAFAGRRESLDAAAVRGVFYRRCGNAVEIGKIEEKRVHPPRARSVLLGASG
jgi:hypothetical protein